MKARLFLSLFVVLVSAEASRAQSALDGFDQNANGAIQAIVVQPDGKILIGGAFTTLTNNGVVAIGETVNEFFAVCYLTRRDYFLSRGVRMREADVCCDCSVKKKIILQYNTQFVTIVLQAY